MGNILHIEDNETFGRIMKQELESEGHHVVTAVSAEAAREILKNQPFDIILSDNELGEGKMRGIQFAMELHEQGSRTPFISMTSDSWEKIRARDSLHQSTPALGEPVSAYIDKKDRMLMDKLLSVIGRFTRSEQSESRTIV